MSSDLPSGGPSEPPEDARGGGRGDLDLASLLRLRGGPLLEALERHVPGSREHAESTATYAFAGAVGLGFGRAQAEVAREAALLHEVGLVYVPAAIAAIPEADRSPEAEEAWSAHYEAGYRLLHGAGIPDHACAWLLRARERYDGSGPEGLAAEAIPIESRLIRAACACQRLLAARGLQGAIEGLTLRAGDDIDPRVAAALNAILGRSGSGV